MKIPEPYPYLYRNLIRISNGRRFVDSDILFKTLKTVVRKAPKVTYRKMINIMQEFKMIKQISKDNYLIIRNGNLQKQIEKTKEHIFPINIFPTET